MSDHEVPPTARRYSQAQKNQAVRLVRQIRKETGERHGAVQRVARQLGWIAVSDLVELMALLDVDEQAVRSAVSRMTRRGLLKPEVRHKVRGYHTTRVADDLLADGDRRIYTSMEPAKLADGWVLVGFSMPERDRDKRHVLGSKLMWHGMGNLSKTACGSVWPGSCPT